MARQPTPKELAALRKERFGDEAGAVHINTDVRTGDIELVFVDAAGEETGREPWTPPDEEPPGVKLQTGAEEDPPKTRRGTRKARAHKAEAPTEPAEPADPAE